ncbi:hypothetical protein HanRHA438_Chr16g0743001 [Helianthus annuus]|nr:hypothetical protein HanRHA438_Chr16g0743001 [Helianthus annuus]
MKFKIQSVVGIVVGCCSVIPESDDSKAAKLDSDLCLLGYSYITCPNLTPVDFD